MSFKLTQFVIRSSKSIFVKYSLDFLSFFRIPRFSASSTQESFLSGHRPLRRLLFPFPFITLAIVKCESCTCCECDGNGCCCCGAGQNDQNQSPKTMPSKPFTIPQPCPEQPLPVPPCPPTKDNTPTRTTPCQYFESKLDSEDTMTSVLGLAEQKCHSPGRPIELTHDFLIKQACSVNADSVTRILNETISTLDDYHQQYREMIGVCMDILEQSRYDGSSTSQELLTCKMIVLRSQMDELKKAVLEIESFLCSVEKLAYASAETAYLARAEYPSIALSERIQSALREAHRIKTQTKELERDLIELQSVIIVESGNSLK